MDFVWCVYGMCVVCVWLLYGLCMVFVWSQGGPHYGYIIAAGLFDSY